MNFHRRFGEERTLTYGTATEYPMALRATKGDEKPEGTAPLKTPNIAP